MIRVSFTHHLPCEPGTYWDLVLDREYGEALFLGALGFVRYEVKEQHDLVRHVTRVVDAEPPTSGLVKFAAGSLRDTEVAVVDRSASSYTFRTLHPSSQVEGQMLCTREGPGRSVRRTDLEITVKTPLVGPSVERAMAKELERSYAVSEIFTGHWLGRQRQKRPA